MLTYAVWRMRGAAMVEFYIVAMFALLPLCLGILQAGLLLVENHHIDHAAFLAARQGAVANGDMTQVRRAFTTAANILFVESGSPLNRSNVTQRVLAAHAAATVDVGLHARFRLLSPNAAAQADFAIRRGGRRVIPNDALEHRSMLRGRQSALTVQQANILRIEVSYCRPLIVPFARGLLLGTLRWLDADPWHQRCYGAGRVPIKSQGTVPMQSDFRVSS